MSVFSITFLQKSEFLYFFKVFSITFCRKNQCLYFETYFEIHFVQNVTGFLKVEIECKVPTSNGIFFKYLTCHFCGH